LVAKTSAYNTWFDAQDVITDWILVDTNSGAAKTGWLCAPVKQGFRDEISIVRASSTAQYKPSEDNLPRVYRWYRGEANANEYNSSLANSACVFTDTYMCTNTLRQDASHRNWLTLTPIGSQTVVLVYMPVP